MDKGTKNNIVHHALFMENKTKTNDVVDSVSSKILTIIEESGHEKANPCDRTIIFVRDDKQCRFFTCFLFQNSIKVASFTSNMENERKEEYDKLLDCFLTGENMVAVATFSAQFRMEFPFVKQTIFVDINDQVLFMYSGYIRHLSEYAIENGQIGHVTTIVSESESALFRKAIYMELKLNDQDIPLWLRSFIVNFVCTPEQYERFLVKTGTANIKDVPNKIKKKPVSQQKPPTISTAPQNLPNIEYIKPKESTTEVSTELATTAKASAIDDSQVTELADIVETNREAPNIEEAAVVEAIPIPSETEMDDIRDTREDSSETGMAAIGKTTAEMADIKVAAIVANEGAPEDGVHTGTTCSPVADPIRTTNRNNRTPLKRKFKKRYDTVYDEDLEYSSDDNVNNYDDHEEYYDIDNFYNACDGIPNIHDAEESDASID